MSMKFDEIIRQSKASIEKEDLKVLLPIVASIKPKNILEIGTWKGYSAETWIEAFEPNQFVSIEIEKGIRDYDNPIYNFWEVDSHDPYTKTRLVEGAYGEFDFLFIDGDHSLKGVTQDFEMYSPLVRKGGIIALHDILHYNENPEVNIKPFWHDLKIRYPFVEIKASKNSTGMGIVFV